MTTYTHFVLFPPQSEARYFCVQETESGILGINFFKKMMYFATMNHFVTPESLAQ